MSTIDQAVQLIRQGNKKEAQKILQAAIKSNPKDVPAWFWYVETCSTDKERIQLLEVCQKMNPGNTQVAQALQTLKGKYNVSSSQPAKHIAPFQFGVQARTPDLLALALLGHRSHSSRRSGGPVQRHPAGSPWTAQNAGNPARSASSANRGCMRKAWSTGDHIIISRICPEVGLARRASSIAASVRPRNSARVVQS